MNRCDSSYDSNEKGNFLSKSRIQKKNIFQMMGTNRSTNNRYLSKNVSLFFRISNSHDQIFYRIVCRFLRTNKIANFVTQNLEFQNRIMMQSF